MNGSQIDIIVMPDCTRVGTPRLSREFCITSAFITVASMPMWSACARSMPASTPHLPRQILPPPITRQIWQPSSIAPLISSAYFVTAGTSMP